MVHCPCASLRFPALNFALVQTCLACQNPVDDARRAPGPGRDICFGHSVLGCSPVQSSAIRLFLLEGRGPWLKCWYTLY